MISPEKMLVQAGYILDDNTIQATKEEVYKSIVRYLAVATTVVNFKEFKEANFCYLVPLTILPVGVTVTREKQIFSEDSGFEEFVVMDVISIVERRNILLIEAKTESL